MENSICSDMQVVLNKLGIKGQCVAGERHRHLAHFDIRLDTNKSAIRNLSNACGEIALGIRSKTIPFLKVIPEEGIVRLQVAMTEAAPISHKELIFNKSVPLSHTFPLLLGEDENGKLLWMDMAKNPHLLIAGSTGSGKSTLLHVLIGNAVYIHCLRHRNIKLTLIDPKRIEFTKYACDLFDEIITVRNTYEETMFEVDSFIELMDSRYVEMQKSGMRSVEEDPKKFVLNMMIIDEVADLFLEDNSECLRKKIIKLAQKGRAAGIYLVLATQRPSVDVINGTIKANFPGRIACKTASKVDSKVVLDEIGAEHLLGRGDAILKNMEFDRVRFQVAYTNFEEIHKFAYELAQEYIFKGTKNV